MTDPLVTDWGWWRERRPGAGPIHLDSAAAGRSSLATLAATAAHAEREATTGAYVAQEEAGPVLAEGRASLARLLGVPARGVAFMPSAQAALDTLLAIWPLREGDTVAVLPCEWGPNLDVFAARGLRITEIATHGDGSVDLAALERMLAGPPPAAVHLVQVATSHRGLVQPVAEAAALCRAAGVPLWVDAAQALGHVDTACGADAIYATSRKWLTGPRGVGVLGVTEPWWDRLRIVAPELEKSVWARGQQPALAAGRDRGERGRLDRPVHGRRGVHRSRPVPDLGPPRRGRQGRPARPWSACPAGPWPTRWPPRRPSSPCARPTARTSARPWPRPLPGIVTTAASIQRAPRDMTEPLLRVSPHVDCTPGDLDRLRQALLTLG